MHDRLLNAVLSRRDNVADRQLDFWVGLTFCRGGRCPRLSEGLVHMLPSLAMKSRLLAILHEPAQR
jgi:hypothetical protein